MVLIREEGFVVTKDLPQFALGAVALNRAAHAARRHEGYFALGRRQKKSWSPPTARRLPSRRILANSFTPRSRSERANPSLFIRYGQFPASLGAAAAQDIPARFRSHAAAEAMHGLSAAPGGLVGALHVLLSFM